MMSQDKVTSHFKKRKATEPQFGKTRSAAKKETQSQQQRQQQQRQQAMLQQQQQQAQQEGTHTSADLSEYEHILRAFDLNYKFGPCTGMTRLERWERASKLGLEPPAAVLEILEKCGAQSAANRNLWHNRI